MTQLQAIKQKPLSDLYDAIELNKTNPSGIFRASIEAFESVMNGEVSFLDPTNPTIMLWESAAVGSAVAVNESVALLRLQYPTLAENSYELYNHMSDLDYTNRFAKPGSAPIGFLFSLTTLTNNMVRDEKNKCKKAVVPRDTEVKIGEIVFTLQYPIVIELFDTGTLSVSYDAEIMSPLQTLETNKIFYNPVQKPDGTWFLYFEIPLMQFQIETISDTVQSGRVFKLTIPFVDQFYCARVFIRNKNTSNVWREIKITHSDLVYDIRTPTVLLRVEKNILTVMLPQIYTVGGALLGDIKVYTYTTKGAIVENLSSYTTSIELRALDPDRDLSIYTTDSLSAVPREALASTILSGGEDELTFEMLRERVIFNSTGPQVKPITSSQVQASVESDGFEIIKYVDVLTNRIFLAAQKLPKPSNSKLAISANIGIETFITDRETLKDNSFVFINNDRWTLTPKNLFIKENGVLRLLSSKEVQNLSHLEITAKVNNLNSNNYLYTPFHWVFDNSTYEFSLRGYYLDKPTLSTINFIRQNQTLELAVNTAARWIERTESGYKLSIRVLSGNFYKNLPDSQVSAQLMFYPQGENIPVYINGYQSNTPNGTEREFSFDINTNYDINDKDGLRILNVGIDGLAVQNVWADLETEFHIFLCTTSLTKGYLEDSSKALLGSFQLQEGTVPITHESVKTILGVSLKNLWSRARSLTVGYEYEKYSNDIPMTYDRDIYKTDPITGEIFTVSDGIVKFIVENKLGDPVLDMTGKPVLKYRKGDAVIDSKTGTPLLKNYSLSKKEVDLLFIDGKNYFVNDKSFTDYNQELIDILVKWITYDLANIQNRLIDLTDIYFHPRSQLGTCQVDCGGGVIISIDSEQSPVVDLYVSKSVYSDIELRTTLENKTFEILDNYLALSEINKTDIEAALREAYGATVISFNLYNLGGKNDIHYAKIISLDKRLSLKRVLDIQADGLLIMKRDVTINFL